MLAWLIGSSPRPIRAARSDSVACAPSSPIMMTKRCSRMPWSAKRASSSRSWNWSSMPAAFAACWKSSIDGTGPSSRSRARLAGRLRAVVQMPVLSRPPDG